MPLIFVDDDTRIIDEKTVIDKHDILQYIINKKVDLQQRKNLSNFEKAHLNLFLSEMYDFVHAAELTL